MSVEGIDMTLHVIRVLRLPGDYPITSQRTRVTAKQHPGTQWIKPTLVGDYWLQVILSQAPTRKEKMHVCTYPLHTLAGGFIRFPSL